MHLKSPVSRTGILSAADGDVAIMVSEQVG